MSRIKLDALKDKCPYCQYKVIPKIEVGWDDEGPATWLVYNCTNCGSQWLRNADAAKGE